jgi:hypothetical protein
MCDAAALSNITHLYSLTVNRDTDLGALWVTSSFMGHASPAVSLADYLASVEWAQFLWRPRTEIRFTIPLRVGAQLAGISVRELQRLAQHPARPKGRIRLEDLRVILARRVQAPRPAT